MQIRVDKIGGRIRHVIVDGETYIPLERSARQITEAYARGKRDAYKEETVAPVPEAPELPTRHLTLVKGEPDDPMD